MAGTPEYGWRDGVLTFRLPDAPLDQGSTALDGELQLRGFNFSAGVQHCEPRQLACSAALTMHSDGFMSIPVSIR